jgi:hypothetical protein
MLGQHPDGTWKKFEELTEEEMYLICNGCGGKGGIITPPYAVFFDTSCDHHDYGYYKGGTEKDRLKCDIELRKAMIRDCKKLPWYKWLKYRPWCELYYIGVRLKGDKYFRYVA